MNEKMFEIMKNKPGFIAALDQSGGSSSKTLKNYGIEESEYSSEEEMFNLIHEMRKRVFTSKAFTNDHIIGAILFEKTMLSKVNGQFTADYLWNEKQIVSFLKVDKGLAEQANGVKLMKEIPELDEELKEANERENEATIFGYYVKDPRAYGVVEIDENGKAVSIEEKPENPKSNYAVPGLYFYTNEVIEIAKNVKPSARGELEITSINEEYMKRGQLKVEKLGRGMTWFDTGTHDALIETASFVQTIQKRQGLQICCPEEIAFDKGWINSEQLSNLAQKYMKTDYGKYLKDVADNVFGEE